MSNLA